MFSATIAKIKDGNIERDEHNALLESFLLHSRCIINFLYPEKPRADDVIADDFFSNPKILRSALPISLSCAKDVRFRTGKEIAHLTYSRLNITPAQKQWNIGKIHDEITSALEIFFKTLDVKQLKWFKTIVKDNTSSTYLQK